MLPIPVAHGPVSVIVYSMSKVLTRKGTPEERELAKKRVELDALEGQLTQRELDLATMQAELHALENQYLRSVGVRYAELDTIEALIAQLRARLFPQDAAAQEHAAEAQCQARESTDISGSAPREDASFTPSDELKQQYRQVARLLHPDLVTDPLERERRHRFMTDVNAAYAANDAARLQAILAAWQDSPESVSGDGLGADLIRMIRKIAQVEDRLTAIDDEIEALKSSDLYDLCAEVQAAATQGRDLVVEMATLVDSQIVAIREQFAALMSKR